MKNFFESMAVAFAMYSKIPMPRVTWNKENMKYCLCFFPLIGAAIGIADGLWFRLCSLLQWSDLLRASVLTVLPLIITGGIHMDGFLDTSDALASWQPAQKKLRILSDSHVGAFAVISAGGYLTLSLGILSQSRSNDMILIGAGFMLSRAWSGLGVVTLKKAKTSGLLRTFSDAAVNARVRTVMIIYIAAISAGIILLDPFRGLAESVVCALVFLYYRFMAYHKFGGITGDLAGFYVQISELAMAAAVILLSP